MITIYTDGACSGNPGRGGWAYKVITSEGRDYLRSGPIPYTTNNAAETMAVIKALQDTAIAFNEIIHIYTDSQYVICCVDRLKAGKPIKTNTGLWDTVRSLTQGRTIRWHKTKAHDIDIHNNDCDKAARKHTK